MNKLCCFCIVSAYCLYPFLDTLLVSFKCCGRFLIFSVKNFNYLLFNTKTLQGFTAHSTADSGLFIGDTIKRKLKVFFHRNMFGWISYVHS